LLFLLLKFTHLLRKSAVILSAAKDLRFSLQASGRNLLLDYSAGRRPSTFGTAMAEALEEGRFQFRNGSGAAHGFKQILPRRGRSWKLAV
jgi:hypothetical protein